MTAHTPKDRGARGGQGGSEPRLRVRRREGEAVQLATEGRSQHEIARTLGISQPAVSQILRRVDDRWVRDHQDQVARHKAEQSRKLNHIYREALRAWDRSKAQRTRRRQRKTEGRAAAGAATVAELIVEDSHGDARHLENARRALADLARVWGVTSPASGPATAETLPVRFTLNLDTPSDPPAAIRRRLAATDPHGE